MSDKQTIFVGDIPSAASFSIGQCSDPTCGPHFVLLDAHGKPIAQMIIGRAHVAKVCDGMLDFLAGITRFPDIKEH